MKLRTRTLLSVALSLVSLVAILYSVARVSIMRSFAALEADDTRQNLARATAVLADDLSTLDNTTSDYAAWDDTCAFLEGRKPDLPTSEFPDPWFPRLRIDFVLIFDRFGRQVFAKAYDPVAGKKTEIPQGLWAHLAPGSPLIHHTHPGSKVLGIALLASGAVLIDSQPILDSESRGPIRGTFIAGRRLDAAEIARLSAISHLSICDGPVLASATHREASWSRFNFFWGMFRCKRPNATLAASSGFDQLSMIALASSRILELGARLWKGCRRHARNIPGANDASTCRASFIMSMPTLLERGQK